MKKQIRNALLVVAALLLVVLFYFLPNIQAALVDKKTFGQSEDLSLNPVEISGRIGIYAIQNKKQTYIPIEWSGYGFMINNVYNN